jgi:hypothetical protein
VSVQLNHTIVWCPYWADPGKHRPGEITATTGVAGSISRTPAAISWRSSPGLTAAARRTSAAEDYQSA